MDIKDRIKAIAAYYNINMSQFEKRANLSNGYVNSIRNSISEKKLEQITNAFEAVDKVWLKMGVGEMIKTDIKLEKTTIRSDAILIGEVPNPEDLQERTTNLGNNRFLKLIPLVPLDIHAGYVEHYNDIVYINQAFEPFPFIATSPGHGNYIAFIVRGNSMDDGTPDGITDSSIVVGREIQRHHWRNKLHLHRFEDYVIIHKEIMTCKRIVDHDTINGVIYCTSINPDKVKFRDFELYLDDCLQIFNIISVTKNR